MMKKLLAVLLIVCMLLPLAACGEKNTPAADPVTPVTPTEPTAPAEPVNPTADPTEPTAPAADPTEPAAPAEPEKQWLPLVEPAGSKQLVIGLITSANVLDYDNNAETRFYEEQTGIDIVFQQFAGSSSDCATQISLMIASGEKLPDILYGFHGISLANGKEYGNQGYFADLTDYLNDPEYTHFMRESLTTIFGAEMGETLRNQLLMRATYAEDGRIYAFPAMEDVPMDSPCCHAFINQDWLDKLGLQIPHTVDELYNVLVAFRDKDPNGNGKADEIPLLGGVQNNYTDPVEWIVNAFIYCNFSNYFNVENNVLSTPFNTDEYRQALIFLKKLYDENLLVKSNFTSSDNERRSLFNPSNGVYKVGIACGHMDLAWQMNNEAVQHYVAVGPLADATGKGGYGCRDYYTMQFNTYVSADCKDIDLAVRFIDFTRSSEAYMRQRWGEYGVDWEWSDGSGQSCAGNAPKFRRLNESTWGDQNSQCWHQVCSISSEYYWSYEISDFDPTSSDSCRVKNLIENYDLYKAAGMPEQVYFFGLFNQEETDDRADYTSDLVNYFLKARTDFISGALDPNSDAVWNEYLKTLKDLQYDRYVEGAQIMWDREGLGDLYMDY